MSRYLFTIAALLVFPSAVAAADKSKVANRWAVLVGVDDYIQIEDLRYCGADQRALRERLVAAGFPTENIFLLEDKAEKQYLPFRANIEKQLELVLGLVEEDDLVLVAFSGHGAHFDGKSYFCPTDANLDDAATLVSLDEVYRKFDASAAALKLLLVDACRDNPRQPGRRSGGGATPREEARAFAQTLERPPEGVVLLNSCTAGEFSFEDRDLGHGVFMNYVLEGLGGAADADGDREVSINELSRYANGKTKAFVARKFNDMQRPFMKGDLTLDVLDFGLARVGGVVPPVIPPTTPSGTPQPAGPALPVPANLESTTNSIGMRLILIPAGEFQMGSPIPNKDADNDELPLHRVRITKPFYLGQTEVTQGQWQAVMGTAPWSGQAFVQEGADYAASYVSHDDATAYCKKLSEREGKSYRLPTEAEWEYACRAGTTTRYCFGDRDESLNDYAWWGGLVGEGNCKDEQYAHQVGRKRPNAWGLHDMHGNVWEWCYDGYDAGFYKTSRVDDPWVAAGSERVVRGGSWVGNPSFCRSADRGSSAPSSRNNFIGFRVVLVP